MMYVCMYEMLNGVMLPSQKFWRHWHTAVEEGQLAPRRFGWRELVTVLLSSAVFVYKYKHKSLLANSHSYLVVLRPVIDNQIHLVERDFTPIICTKGFLTVQTQESGIQYNEKNQSQ